MRQRADALLVTADPIFTNQRTQLIALANPHRLPAIYQWSLYVASGGLMSYGTDIADVHRQAGHYTARVLKGEEAGRPAGAAADEIPARHQSHGRKRAGTDAGPADAHRTR